MIGAATDLAAAGHTPEAFARFRTAPLRRRQALDLSRLDDRLLRDIGVSRADAEEEQRRLLRF